MAHERVGNGSYLKGVVDGLWALVSVAVLACLMSPLLSCPARALNQPDVNPFVFTQVPADAWEEGGSEFALPDLHVTGSRLVRWDGQTGKLTVLTPDLAGAADPEVSFDGSRIYFSGQEKPGGPWNLYVMDADGQNLELLLDGYADATEPTLAGILNLLNDPEYDQLLFVSTAAGTLNEVGTEPAKALYACRLDGSDVTRLSFNLSSDWSPSMLEDGRVMFTSWQRANGRHAPHGLLPLMALNTDGTDLMPFYGNHEMPRMKTMARQTSDWHVVFVESDGTHPSGGGQLARVNLRRPLHWHEVLAEDNNGLFHTPCPLPDGRLLVAYRPEGSHYGLRWFDVEKKRLDGILFDSPEWHEIDAAPLAPRWRPHGRSTFVQEDHPSGVIFTMNVYESQEPDVAALPKGSIQQVRVIEGLPRRADEAMDEALPPELGRPLGATQASATAYGRRRLIGIAPVEQDGSFHLIAPPNTPLYFQLLDERGMAVKTLDSWVWVRPRENRGCIGCHEDREMSPPNVTVQAIVKPGANLVLPPQRRRMVEYVHHIRPILDTHCGSCHDKNAEGRPRIVFPWDGSTGFSDGYLALIDGTSAHGRYVVPGSARDSTLVQHIAPGDGDTASGVQRLAPEHRPSKIEIQQIIEWVDMGAQYLNMPRSIPREVENP